MDDRLRILDTDALSLAQRSHPVVVKRLKAIALEKNAILATSNLQDFSKVPDLAIEDWSIAEEAVV